MVALFHFPAYTNAHVLIAHSDLFVDLFFVISGFVIAANYQGRLGAGVGVGRFMWLRFGRLYPLHVAVLAAFVVYRLGIKQDYGDPRLSVETIIANATMTHGLNLFDFLTWNYPSWSISAEFFTYFIFAGAVVTMGRRTWLAMLAAVAVCPLVLYALKGHIVATYDYSLIRCIYGFSCGALTWALFTKREIGGSLMEMVAVALALAFITATGHNAISLMAPLFFSLLVWVFASEAGLASALLKQRPFLLLGTLSYSIYMLHAMFSAKLQAMDEFYHVAYLPLVIGASWFSYHWLEAPVRDWFRSVTASSSRSTNSYPNRPDPASRN